MKTQTKIKRPLQFASEEARQEFQKKFPELKTKTQHTPTPWNYESSKTSTERYVTTIRKNNEAIALLNMAFLNAEANAEFIVKAVNNHSSLVSSLKLALRLIGDVSGSNIDASLNHIKQSLAKAGE